MDSIINRLLIFTLFVFVSLSIGSPISIPFVDFNGTITTYPGATIVNNNSLPFYFTGYPGAAYIAISAFSSVAVCVSPYAAVTSNLATQCPNLINFIYTSSNPESEFLLFLDDFSMNFLGQDGKSFQTESKKDQTDIAIPPYQYQTSQISLLQDVPYYVTIGLIDNFNANETQREVQDFTLSAHYAQCNAGTAPNPQLITNPEAPPCIPLKSQLTPTNSSSPPLVVSKSSPLVFTFQIPTLSLSARLDFHILELKYNLSIYIGYGYVASAANNDYSFQSSASLRPDSAVLAEYLGDFGQSFSINITNPKVGTYYATVYSGLETLEETNFNIEFNTTECDLGGVCGGYTIQSVDSSTVNAQNITLSDIPTYISITGEDAIFGFETGPGEVALFQVGINAIPSGAVSNQNYYQAVSNSSLFTLSSPLSQSYVFLLANGEGVNTSQVVGPYTALVWTGAVCPNNCEGQGTCNNENAQCECNENYSGRYCQIAAPPAPGTPSAGKKKKLSTLYIILIIIGGAILLAILIGVPVALFLNNRKKARYERV